MGCRERPVRPKRRSCPMARPSLSACGLARPSNQAIMSAVGSPPESSGTAASPTLATAMLTTRPGSSSLLGDPAQGRRERGPQLLGIVVGPARTRVAGGGGGARALYGPASPVEGDDLDVRRTHVGPDQDRFSAHRMVKPPESGWPGPFSPSSSQHFSKYRPAEMLTAVIILSNGVRGRRGGRCVRPGEGTAEVSLRRAYNVGP